MEHIIETYKNQDIFLVGALDSLGVPYTIDNNKMKSFVELTADLLRRKGLNIIDCNLCSLGRNKTWELEKVLQRNYTIGTYQKLNKLASQYVISGKREREDWPFPTNPNFIDRYYANPDNASLFITSELQKNKNVIFLYSCGGMNIRDALKIKSTMNFQDCKTVAHEVMFHACHHIQQTKLEVEHCIRYIKGLNPNMEIYVLGVYAMLDNATLRDLVFPFVEWYNHDLKQIVAKFDHVHYVDIRKVKNMVAPNDMHPTLEGQEYISKQIVKTMNEVCKKR